MLAKAEEILKPFARRIVIEQADATALHYPDGRFDFVLSFIMLHHVIKWEDTLSEMCRVVKPAGRLVAYDLLNIMPMRLLHQAEGAGFRMMRFEELQTQLRGLPLEDMMLRRGLASLVVRFVATRAVRPA